MTLKNDQTLFDLMGGFAHPGTLRRIGIRPRHRACLNAVESAELVAGRGIAGDHRAERQGGRRQVTLLQYEHLAVVAALCGRRKIDPASLRRNLVVAGINVLALVGCRFRIGEAELEGTGPCHPCSRMEETLGTGGYNAVRGHGGITAAVLCPGVIRTGDPIIVTPARRVVDAAAHGPNSRGRPRIGAQAGCDPSPAAD